MIESSFIYKDCHNNEIVVTLEYVRHSDMKYTVVYCSAYNTIYQYLSENYIEVKRVYRTLLHDILTLNFVPNMEKLGFTIYEELPF